MKKERYQLHKGRGWAIAGLILLILGGSCLTVRALYRAKVYEQLTGISASSEIQTRQESYLQAIELYPGKADAYSLLLDTFSEDGDYSKQESEKFISIYNTHNTSWSKSTATGQLMAKAGLLYINGYNESFTVTLRMAYPFFQQAVQILSPEDEGYQLALLYYDMGTYYQEYIWSATSTKDISPEQMSGLMADIAQHCQTLNETDEVAIYDRLGFYLAVCSLISDQRDVIAQTCPQEQIQGILDTIYSNLPDADTLQKEKTKQMLQTLLDTKQTYTEMISRAYSRSQGGGGQ